MKKLFFTVVAFALLIVGCSKNDEGQGLYKETDYADLNLKINLLPNVQSPVYYGTKATGNDHGNGTYDKVLNRLDIFIFDQATGQLDGYKSFTSSELSALTGLEIKTKLGKKEIYAVANADASAWSGIVSKNQFLQIENLLKNENYKSLVMSGSVTKEITASCDVEMTIQRLACRIVVNNVKSAFAGTPYAGQQLQNVKVYLTNVNGNVTIGKGEHPATPVFLNKGGYVASDNSAFVTSGALYDVLGNVGDAGITSPHYFYCYENTIDEESDTEKFTRLVIEATLNGETYYYPININREKYGWNASNGHKGVMRNRSYQYDITILRPGSTDPDEIVDISAFSLDVSIDDWKIIPNSNVEF